MENIDSRFIEVPKLENDTVFQDFCEDFLNDSANYNIVQQNGRSGQNQDGVDVFARKKSDNNWIGVQCKVRSTNNAFSEKELRKEIDKTKNFNPKLTEYYLYTTLNRDTVTQELVRVLNDELVKSGLFQFNVIFWDDITAILKEQNKYLRTYFKYYKKFFRDNTSLGHSIGKLINIRLGIDEKYDTSYEIILGKIPDTNSEYISIDYYRGLYFIVNFWEMKFGKFGNYGDDNNILFNSYNYDLRTAFSNDLDRFVISKWLSSIGNNIDDIIYGSKSNHEYSITKEEHNKFLEHFNSKDDD
jgi:hypothetical protein